MDPGPYAGRLKEAPPNRVGPVSVHAIVQDNVGFHEVHLGSIVQSSETGCYVLGKKLVVLIEEQTEAALKEVSHRVSCKLP